MLPLIQQAFPSPGLTVATCCGVVAVCVVGDYLVFKSPLLQVKSSLSLSQIKNSDFVCLGL